MLQTCGEIVRGQEVFCFGGRSDASQASYPMKSFAICVLLTPVIAGGGLALWPQPPGSAASMSSPSLPQAALVALTAAASVQPEPAKPGHHSVSNRPGTMDLHT